MTKPLRRTTQLRIEPRESPCPPGWAWLLAGILIGVFFSFLYYLREVAPTAPLTAIPEATAVSKPSHSIINVEKSSSSEKPPTAVVAPDPPPTVTAPSQFEFYEMLKGVESKPPPPPPLQPFKPTPVVVKPIQAPGVYTIQVGSFRDISTAEGLKAHLALLGVEAYIQDVVLNGSDIWHRVRVGPFNDLDRLNLALTQLAENHISADLVKMK